MPTDFPALLNFMLNYRAKKINGSLKSGYRKIGIALINLLLLSPRKRKIPQSQILQNSNSAIAFFPQNSVSFEFFV
jgi:hypothetical protein